MYLDLYFVCALCSSIAMLKASYLMLEINEFWMSLGENRGK